MDSWSLYLLKRQVELLETAISRDLCRVWEERRKKFLWLERLILVWCLKGSLIEWGHKAEEFDRETSSSINRDWLASTDEGCTPSKMGICTMPWDFMPNLHGSSRGKQRYSSRKEIDRCCACFGKDSLNYISVIDFGTWCISIVLGNIFMRICWLNKFIHDTWRIK